MMRITENFASLDVAMPKAVRVLQQLDGVSTFHEQYGVRHPLASYNVSLSAVARRLRTVLEVLSQTQRDALFIHEKKGDWAFPLLEATDHMLDALMEHLDDCGGIIRSFFSSVNDKHFKKVHGDYKRSVEPYRDHIGKIVNYIKHNQGRLRSVVFNWPSGSSLGYFVEGPVSEGGLWPVACIHPTESTAFSYNRDVAFHVCNLFAVGSRLAAALYSIDKRLVPIDTLKSLNSKDSDLSQVLMLTSALPYIYFPDELEKDVPSVRVKSNSVYIGYPSARIKVIAPPGGSRIAIAFAGDGVTRSFKMPYFNAYQ